MGDAGLALPSGISAGLVNPSLVNIYRKEIKETHGSVTAGFGRDSLYNKLMLPFGVSYSSEDGSIALFYRHLSGESELSNHEVTLNLSGMLFPGSEEQGAVDFGVNVRLEMIKWKNMELDPLSMVTSHLDTIKPRRNDTLALAAPEQLRRTLNQTNLILDLGFYQPDAFPNFDFGMTLKNITGFSWRTVNPYAQNIHDTLNDSTVIDSLTYVSQKKKKGQWIDRKYKTLAVGVVYHVEIKPESFTLLLPLDLEVLGLFDKKMKNKFVFKGGIEAQIAGHFSIRMGYSRAPGILMRGFSQIKNLNFFTGGGGVKIDPVTFDFYISHNVFGTTLSFDY
jgi:hypothetical protein